MSSSRSSDENNEDQAPSIVVDAKSRLETIELTNSLQFLAEVRKIAKEFNTKTDAVEQSVAESKENLTNKLESLKICKKDLLLLKESIISLRDEYLNNAKETVQRLKEEDPEILEAFGRLIQKTNRLKSLELEKQGSTILENLKEAASLGNIDAVCLILDSAFAHEKKCTNFDSSLMLFSSSLSTTCDIIFGCLKNQVLSTLEELKFPFEEGVTNVPTQVAVLQKYIQVFKSILERRFVESWPVEVAEIFFEPIYNRFVFHFYGERKTNDKSNARWFLIQLLSWIRANLCFFELILHPLKGILDFNPAVYFHRRISSLAIEKIRSLLVDDELIADQVLFAKLIDDCIEFEEERQQIDRLECGLNCLSPLCEDEVIIPWIEMENEVSQTHLDDILKDSNRWKNRLGEICDADEFAVCQCADAFVTHVQCIQDRSRLLPDASAKRRFVELQLLLFDDFRKRLSQIASTAQSPWNEPFPQIMNTIWFLYETLKEWSETNLLDEQNGETVALREISSMYKHQWLHMANSIGTSIRVQVTELAHQYQQYCWALVDAFASVTREISPCFCPLLMNIRSTFASAGSLLSQISIKAAFDLFISEVAKVLLKEVVYCTAFVESGASQMLFDIEEGLIPVLNNIFDRNNVQNMQCIYNKHILKLVGSLRLLSLPWAVATLLREEIANSSPEQTEEKLLEMKITGVDVDDAMRLFSLRNDMKNSSLITMTVR